MDVTTTPAAINAYADLTPSARTFMALVGARHFDFFDDGIVEFSGNWGSNLTWQAVPAVASSRVGVAGVMTKLAKSGLWTHEAQPNGLAKSEVPNDSWWALTALGADVAKLALAISDAAGA